MNNPLKQTDPTGYQTAPAPGAVSWPGGGGGWGNVGPHWSHYMPNVFSDPVWGYCYDWYTKTYYAEHYYGNDEVVPFEEVRDEYILPNSVDITNLVSHLGNSSNKNSKNNGGIEKVNTAVTFAGLMAEYKELNATQIDYLTGNVALFSNAGNYFFWLGFALSGMQIYEGYQTGNYNEVNMGELDMAMGIVSLMGPAGFGIGAIYFTAEALGAFSPQLGIPENIAPMQIYPADKLYIAPQIRYQLVIPSSPPLTPSITGGINLNYP